MKFFRKLNIFSLVRCFSVKIEQTSKNHWKMAVFQHFWLIFRVFWSLLNFDWKTVHQIKEFKFCNKFCFFWYVCCPQTRDNSGAIFSFIFCFEILCLKRPLVVFLLFSKWSLILSKLVWTLLEGYIHHIWRKNAGIIMWYFHFRHEFGWNQMHFS